MSLKVMFLLVRLLLVMLLMITSHCFEVVIAVVVDVSVYLVTVLLNSKVVNIIVFNIRWRFSRRFSRMWPPLREDSNGSRSSLYWSPSEASARMEYPGLGRGGD